MQARPIQGQTALLQGQAIAAALTAQAQVLAAQAQAQAPAARAAAQAPIRRLPTRLLVLDRLLLIMQASSLEIHMYTAAPA